MSSTNVAVAVRCRPISSKESALGSRSVVEVDTEAQSITVASGDDDRRTNTFTFDHVYPGGTSQETIYTDIGAPLITKALEGFNGTVFAYGQTGSGKTFTMMGSLGDAEQAGIVPRLTDDLFDRVTTVIKETGGSLGNDAPSQSSSEGSSATAPVRFFVTVSFLEIYNEVINDLLNPQTDKILKLRENPDTGIYVEHLCELAVKSPSDIIRLIDQGNRVRRVASTAMNERSSRSHSVFTVKIEQKTTKTLEGGIERETALSSKLNLVDLAGSERADKTGAEGSTLKEGAAINQSLMALGGVINALSEGAAHVPYRNSKLTRLLQESLGGNAGTVMVANVSPADYNADETVGTLRYASRAKKIQNKVVRNEDVHERVIRELQEEIERLRAELEAVNSGNGGGGGSRELLTAEQEAELQKKVEIARRAEAELAERIAHMEKAKEHEWNEREQLTAALEEERKNNLNRAIGDVMSSVKEEKKRLILSVRNLQEERAARNKELNANKDTYKLMKKDLEAAMNAYEEMQIAHDRLSKTDPRFDASAEELLRTLDELEQNRASLIEVRGKVSAAKKEIQSIEDEIMAARAELQAAASTIAENDRLRAAIQEEERAAFQSQRDSYLEEQLAAEKKQLEDKKKELQSRESSLNDKNRETADALATCEKKNELLQQELLLVQHERDHLRRQLENRDADIELAHCECGKLEEELRDTSERFHKVELEVEHERSRSKTLEQEIWESQELQMDILRGRIAAQDKELRAMERLALEHKATLRREKVEKAKEQKQAKLQQGKTTASKDASGGGIPDVAESKDGSVSSAHSPFDLAEKDRRIAELEESVSRLTAKTREMEEEFKESGYKIFKGVMDVTAKERQNFLDDRDHLQRLLNQSVQDILHLQQINDDYKRELDLRRSLEADN